MQGPRFSPEGQELDPACCNLHPAQPNKQLFNLKIRLSGDAGPVFSRAGAGRDCCLASGWQGSGRASPHRDSEALLLTLLPLAEDEASGSLAAAHGWGLRC